MGYRGAIMSSVAGGKSLYVKLPASHLLANEAWSARDVVWPVVLVFAICFAAAALFAGLKPAPAVTAKSVSVEPARHIVNGANKGSRLETIAVEAAPIAPERVVIRGPLAETVPPVVKGKSTYGLASYYWQGAKTANGETFNSHDMTAAHRTLPFGTRVRVTSLETGRSVTVRINDRGPYVDGRIVDISRGAAESIGMIERGVTKIKLDVVQ
jgi:rare lipoprotein A